jgi:hypothetical protein
LATYPSLVTTIRWPFLVVNLKLIRSDQVTDASVSRKIIKGIEMQPEENFMRKYYTEEAWARRSQILEEIPLETRERHREAWRQLFLQVESALGGSGK